MANVRSLILQVYGFSVYRLTKDDPALPSPSVSAALPASAPRDASEWRTYQRTHDTLLTRDKINRVDNLKLLVPKETRKASAGCAKAGGKKKASAGGEK